MSSILAVAQNTFRQTLRERLFFNIVVFGIGMLLLAMVMAQITFGYPDRVVRSIGLSGVSIALDLMALMLGVTLIHQEIDRKTLFVVLTRPLHRWQYATGRYLGLVLALATALVGLVIVFSLALWLAHGTLAAGDFIAFAVSLVEAGVIAGIGIVLSSFSTPTLSAGIGLGLWIASATTDDLVRLTEKAGGALHALSLGVYYALPALARFNFREAVIYKHEIPMADFASAVAYGCLYAAVLVGVASAILSRREMV